MTILHDAIVAVLPPPTDPGLKVRQVRAMVPGDYARVTIRHALKKLVETGRAEVSGNDHNRYYRRKAE